jgi:hypothetical protein
MILSPDLQQFLFFPGREFFFEIPPLPKERS